MIVIADDITGAAEIAGIAFSKGQEVRLLCNSSVYCDSVAVNGTIVIATDTRSMSKAEAVAETRHIIRPLSLEGNGGRILFKKTDSALRGHVVAELTALMAATGYQRAVYMPANPTKGRIIKNGVYYINNVPIHETAFSYDPEFPAKTSVLKERFPDAKASGIIMPDAESMDDIRNIISQYNDGHTLFAGAADLFAALLNNQEVYPHDSTNISIVSKLSSTLILCGSTQSKPLDLNIPIAPMPRDIYDGNDDISIWDTSAYEEQHSLILTMPFTHRTGKEVAVRLRTIMAHKAKELIARHTPSHLIIEGGATAWATLQALGWTQFKIERQIAPGVVQMSITIARHTSTNGSKKRVMVTLKPGSYPWGIML